MTGGGGELAVGGMGLGVLGGGGGGGVPAVGGLGAGGGFEARGGEGPGGGLVVPPLGGGGPAGESPVNEPAVSGGGMGGGGGEGGLLKWSWVEGSVWDQLIARPRQQHGGRQGCWGASSSPTARKGCISPRSILGLRGGRQRRGPGRAQHAADIVLVWARNKASLLEVAARARCGEVEQRFMP